MKHIAVLISLLFIPAAAVASTARMIVVPVTLTYQGRTVTASMAVDTAATITTIGPDLAERLGIPRGTRYRGLAEMADGRTVPYRTAILDVAAGGGLVRKVVQVNVMEYSGSRGEIEGWLGINFLENFVLTIDWRNRRIDWSE